MSSAHRGTQVSGVGDVSPRVHVPQASSPTSTHPAPPELPNPIFMELCPGPPDGLERVMSKQHKAVIQKQRKTQVRAHSHACTWNTVSFLATIYTKSTLHYKLSTFFNLIFHYAFESLLLPNESAAHI